jgi:hypothetical protein
MKWPCFGIIALGGITTCLPLPTACAQEKASTGTPKIQFETNFFDFGTLTARESVSGAFKFKNIGDAALKLEPPQASCECTEPRVNPDTLAPGQTGEVTYTIKLDQRLTGHRFIQVRSNDPQNPSVRLNVQLDYTPLYEVRPKSFWIFLPAGKEEAEATATINRTDGKPLGIQRFTSTENWITAAYAPSASAEESSGLILVRVRRPPQPPAPFNARLKIWMTGETEHPAQSLVVEGEIQGEVAAIPSKLYWVIPDFGTNKAAYPAEALTRKIELTSVLGQEVEITNASSDIKGMSVQVLPREGKEARKKYDLILRFDELPGSFANGKVIVETPLPTLPRLEVPMTIAVAK